jgi:L-fuconolactonase
MQRIDAHQHFWQFDPVRDSWINEKMSVIKKDFLPADLLPVLKENGVDGTVIVQSDQSEKENDFQLANAENLIHKRSGGLGRSSVTHRGRSGWLIIVLSKR